MLVRPRWGPAVAPSMWFGRVLPPRSGVLSLPTTTGTNVGGHVCEVPSSALRRLQAGMPSCHTARAAASTEQLEQPGRVHHGTLRASDVDKCPLTGVSSGL